MKKIILISILSILLILLCSCVPTGNIYKAEKKMINKDYIVTLDSVNIPSLLYAETRKQITYVLIATNDSSSLYAFLFRNKEEAKEALEYISKYSQKIIKGSNTKISGTWVYFGTDQGIKDFER